MIQLNPALKQGSKLQRWLDLGMRKYCTSVIYCAVENPDLRGSYWDKRWGNLAGVVTLEQGYATVPVNSLEERTEGTYVPAHSPDHTDELRKNDLAVSLMPMVKRIALSISNKIGTYAFMDDFYSAGSLAIVELMSGVDFQKSDSEIELYVSKRVKGAIFDELSFINHFTHRSYAILSGYRKKAEEFRKQHDRDPSYEELGYTFKQGKLIDRCKARGSTLSMSYSGDKGYMDIPDSKLEDSLGNIIKGETLVKVQQLMEGLTNRQKKIIRLKYLVNWALTKAQMISIVGCSSSMFYKDHKKALVKIRRNLGVKHTAN